MTPEDIEVEEGLQPVFHADSYLTKDSSLCGIPVVTSDQEIEWPWCRKCHALKWPGDEYQP